MSEKQAVGYVMTSNVFQDDDGSKTWIVEVSQDSRCVFFADGCESKLHAEQLARDISVRYALIERPSV